MGTKNIILIVAGLLVIGAGTWWFMGQNDDDQASQTQQETTAAEEARSINELLAQNQELMCTFNHTDEDGTASNGTVYLANGRMSGEFRTNMPGEETINSYIINDGQDQYIWQEGESEGVKFSLADFEDTETDEEAAEEPAGTVDQDEDYDFNCQEWNAQDERFTPPSDIDFVDFSQQLQQTVPAGSASAEELCAQITEPDARAACESAL